jgi:hypothetical protein
VTKGARAGQQATRGVPMSPREGSRVVGCGGEAGGGGGRVGRNGGLGAQAGEGDRAIYSRERGCAARSLRREGFPALMPQYGGRSTAHKQGTHLKPAVRRELVRPVRCGARAGTRCEGGGHFKGSRDAGRPGGAGSNFRCWTGSV